MGERRLVLEHREHQVVLAPGVYFIGRGDEADLLVDDPFVSRLHAAVRVSASGVVTLEDLGSANGISVNGVPIQALHTLEPGDRIGIGDAELMLRTDGRPGTAYAGARTEQLEVTPPPRRRAPTPDGPVRALARLSAREREVLKLIACGLSQREIGERLSLSVKTVETYRARIGDKLELRTRPELMRYAVNAGLLKPD